ncbi:MAG: rRNA maturation RNase YbeY [Halothiobacillaceae bacterium]
MSDDALHLEVQRAVPEDDLANLPADESLHEWIARTLALAGHQGSCELTLRIVDEPEGRELNARWRDRDRATNVLSFPLDMPEHVDIPYLGDLVICAPVVAREALEQGKALTAHWAHLCVHGTLHLLGHDHEQAEEADIMEALEVQILAVLGYPDPYADV